MNRRYLEKSWYWLIHAPKNIPVRNHRYFSMTNSAGIAGLLGHFVLLLSFLYFGITELAVFNTGSLLLFASVFWMNRKGHYQTGLFLAIGEIIVHAIVAVVLLGWDTGFHIYLFLVPISAFLSDDDKKAVILTILSVLMYCGLYLYAEYMASPLVHVSTGMKHFYYLNNLFVTLCIVSIGVFYYKYTANQIENRLHTAHKKITSSIQYAQRIQSSILPDEGILKQNLQDYFIFYLPKDIVSGDFYWFKCFDGEKKLVVAAMDCTGHGVPGAFMTMIAHSLLEKIVVERQVFDPAEILTLLREDVIYLLKQKEGKSQDGMDMALCTINHENKKLTFAGAMSSVYYVQEQEIFEIKATKMSIGGVSKSAKSLSYENHTISFEKPTCFYLFSDGIQDQFGGGSDKKYSGKQLRETLLANHLLPMPEQKKSLEESFLQWKGEVNQIDDVLVIGLKI